MTQYTVSLLVTHELSLIQDSERRTALALLLVPPREEIREWNYGLTGEKFPYWVVADAPDRGIILVYCDHGFGPRFPWGFLFTRGDVSDTYTLGMDSQWCWYLEEAFLRAGLWRGPLKPGYEEAYHTSPEQGRGSNGGAA